MAIIKFLLIACGAVILTALLLLLLFAAGVMVYFMFKKIKEGVQRHGND